MLDILEAVLMVLFDVLLKLSWVLMGVFVTTLALGITFILLSRREP